MIDHGPVAGLLATLLLTATPSALAGHATPCGSLDGLRVRVAASPDAAGRSAVADAFSTCAERAGTPLLFPASLPGRVRALFAFRSSAARVFLAGDMNGWSTSSHPLEKLRNSNLHVLELELPDGARLDYKFVAEGTEWVLDPWNPRTMPGGFGPNSELRTPGYTPPANVDPRPGVPGGRYEELTIESRAIGGPRSVKVWIPPSLAPEAGPLPVLYLLDGLDYREFGHVHTVAGNLVASGKLPPLLLVLVPPVDRGAE